MSGPLGRLVACIWPGKQICFMSNGAQTCAGRPAARFSAKHEESERGARRAREIIGADCLHYSTCAALRDHLLGAAKPLAKCCQLAAADQRRQ